MLQRFDVDRGRAYERGAARLVISAHPPTHEAPGRARPEVASSAWPHSAPMLRRSPDRTEETRRLPRRDANRHRPTRNPLRAPGQPVSHVGGKPASPQLQRGDTRLSLGSSRRQILRRRNSPCAKSGFYEKMLKHLKPGFRKSWILRKHAKPVDPPPPIVARPTPNPGRRGTGGPGVLSNCPTAHPQSLSVPALQRRRPNAPAAIPRRLPIVARPTP